MMKAKVMTMRMKIIDTITDAEYQRILGGDVGGLFKYLRLTVKRGTSYVPFDFTNASFEYYLSHSTSKSVSPFVERLFDHYKNTSYDPNESVALVITNKFSQKWSRIYTELVDRTYNPATNEEYSSNKESSQSVSRDSESVHVGENNDSTKNTSTSTSDSNDSIYGFNSTNPVGTDTSSTSDDTVTEGEARFNNSYNSYNDNESSNENGSYNSKEDRTGRKETSVAKLLEEELDFRSRNIFLDIIYNDIDSITALNIYI